MRERPEMQRFGLSHCVFLLVSDFLMRRTHKITRIPETVTANSENRHVTAASAMLCYAVMFGSVRVQFPCWTNTVVTNEEAIIGINSIDIQRDNGYFIDANRFYSIHINICLYPSICFCMALTKFCHSRGHVTFLPVLLAFPFRYQIFQS